MLIHFLDNPPILSNISSYYSFCCISFLLFFQVDQFDFLLAKYSLV